MFDCGNNLVSGFDIESPVRLNDFLRVGMRPIHDDVQMIVARVLVQGVERLMLGQPHSPKKETDRLIRLLAGGLFVFLPRQNPVRDRHPALNGFLGQRNHLPFLRGNSRGQEIFASGKSEFVPSLLIMSSEDVVHQTADHDGLGFFEAGALELLDNHCFSLRASMARRTSRKAAYSSARVAALPVCFTTSK